MYYTRQNMNWGAGRRGLTEGVKLLLIANGIGYLLQLLTQHQIDIAFGLVPRYVWSRLFIWQPVTYMFLHGDFFHILMNMFMLWMFGTEIERMWGQKAFLQYYMICGIGAGLFNMLVAFNSAHFVVIGASGAVFGILVAYAMMFPDRKIYLYFAIPVPARMLILIYVVIELINGIAGSSGVAHFAHLGGALVGFLYLKKGWQLDSLTGKFKSWNAKRKMHVVQEEEEELDRMRKLVDQILDKANEVGMENLTKDEKTFLKRASKILKKNRK